MHGTLGIGFGGGEPTLYPQFPELCTYATRHTALAVTFTTHGHHLDDRMLEKLEGHVNFVRISMDGVNETYERLRRRSFATLVQRLIAVRQITRFGLNYVVNFETFPDLDRAVALAEEMTASEFLLLPERPVNGSSGITEGVARSLREWIIGYRGTVPLSISEGNSDGLPVSDPFATEPTLHKYAHIDASGTLKRTSFEKTGVTISGDVMTALSQLRHLTA
jgi:MoaA/NifB/PqqE/SkfB family radical SAM enzyme